MKTNIKKFRMMLREAYQEGVKQSQRDAYGYDLEEPVDYDVAEEFDCEGCKKQEGVKQSQRDAYGYDLEEPVDYDIAEVFLAEVSPPSDKAEEFIQKNKKDFKKRYGERWKEVLYKTAWKKFPPKKEELESEAAPPALPSAVSKAATQIRTGQSGIGGDFRSRADAAIDALLQSFRSDTEKKSIFSLINKPTAQKGYKDKFVSGGLGGSQPSSTSDKGFEDPTKWKLDHKVLPKLKAIIEKIDVEFPLNGDDDVDLEKARKERADTKKNKV